MRRALLRENVLMPKLALTIAGSEATGGAGAQAADWAGRMNSDGRAIILVPNKN